MIKLAKKIISKLNPYYDSSGQGKYANPIDAYLKEEVAFRLSRLFRKVTNDENAIVFPSFAYKEKDREVCSMTLSFIVSSCENDILKDKGVFSIFQSVVWHIFNSNTSGYNTFVSVSTSHFISYRNFSLCCYIYSNYLVYTWS